MSMIDDKDKLMNSAELNDDELDGVVGGLSTDINTKFMKSAAKGKKDDPIKGSKVVDAIKNSSTLANNSVDKSLISGGKNINDGGWA